MKSKLFRMCQKVIHVYKLIVIRPQMYNNNLFIWTIFCYKMVR